MMTDRELEQLASNAAQNDEPIEKWLDLSRSVALIAECRQWRKDWDALMVLIAQTVGDEDEREMAEAGEMEEFDPWSALRAHRASALTAEEREDLNWARRVMTGKLPLHLVPPRHRDRALAILTRLAGETP